MVSPTSRHGCWLGVLLVISLSGISLDARADQATASESGLKAVLFFRLPQFVYRPDKDNAKNNQVLCMFGNNPFGKILERLAQEPIYGRTVEIVNLVTADDDIPCDFVFISRSESAFMENSIRKFADKRVVTVSDIPGFAKAGGMVELTMNGDHVGVTLNRKAAQRKGLEFNAQLLRLAKVVEP